MSLFLYLLSILLNFVYSIKGPKPHRPENKSTTASPRRPMKKITTVPKQLWSVIKIATIVFCYKCRNQTTTADPRKRKRLWLFLQMKNPSWRRAFHDSHSNMFWSGYHHSFISDKLLLTTNVGLSSVKSLYNLQWRRENENMCVCMWVLKQQLLVLHYFLTLLRTFHQLLVLPEDPRPVQKDRLA